MTNYLISNLQLTFLEVISAIVYYQLFNWGHTNQRRRSKFMQWKSWIITSMHQNTLFKKPCDFRRGVSQKYSQIIVLFNSKCQNQKQTGSRVQRIGWKQPWITHTLFGGFEYYSAFDWGNYTYKSSTKITSWPNFNHKSQVSIKIIIYCSPDPGMQQPNPKLWILNFHNSSITSAKKWVGGPKKAKNMLT